MKAGYDKKAYTYHVLENTSDVQMQIGLIVQLWEEVSMPPKKTCTKAWCTSSNRAVFICPALCSWHQELNPARQYLLRVGGMRKAGAPNFTASPSHTPKPPGYARDHPQTALGQGPWGSTPAPSWNQDIDWRAAPVIHSEWMTIREGLLV